jgi:hypothetical protein
MVCEACMKDRLRRCAPSSSSQPAAAAAAAALLHTLQCCAHQPADVRAAVLCRRAREAARQNEMAERERRTQELLKSCEVRCKYLQAHVTAEHCSATE